MQSETWDKEAAIEAMLEKPKVSEESDCGVSTDSTPIAESLGAKVREAHPKCVISSLHLQAVILKAQLLPDPEIGAILGKGEKWVEAIIKQPWYADALSEALILFGKDSVEDLLEASEYDSIKALIRLRDDKSTSASVKKACAAEILDRKRGKAVQHIKETKTVTNFTDVGQEAEHLRREMASYDDQLNKRGVFLSDNTKAN